MPDTRVTPDGERRADGEQRVSPARARLAEATRHLLDAVVSADTVADDTLDDASAAIEAATATIAALAVTSSDAGARPPRGFTEYLARNRLIGLAHPLSPAGAWRFADGVLEVRATFGDVHEGPEGFVHGGIVALVFDELLALAAAFGGTGGLTGTLKVRYRKPTPLHEELRLTGWVDRREGRRMRARGTIHVGDVLTAEAEGLFVVAQPESPLAAPERGPRG